MLRPVQGRRRPQNRPLLNFSVFTRADTAPDVVELAGVVVATLSMVCVGTFKVVRFPNWSYFVSLWCRRRRRCKSFRWHTLYTQEEVEEFLPSQATFR